MNNQECKQDMGKLRLSLVPTGIITAIAKVRQWATENKYSDPNNWKEVETSRYVDAMFRHMVRFLDDPDGIDDESGLPHLYHLATNVAFLCDRIEKSEKKGTLLWNSQD